MNIRLTSLLFTLWFTMSYGSVWPSKNCNCTSRGTWTIVKCVGTERVVPCSKIPSNTVQLWVSLLAKYIFLFIEVTTKVAWSLAMHIMCHKFPFSSLLHVIIKCIYFVIQVEIQIWICIKYTDWKELFFQKHLSE